MIYFYEIALLKSPLEPLTYQSNVQIKLGQIVEVGLKNRSKSLLGVVIKEVEKPQFDCNDILSITNDYFNDTIIDTAKFISKYYVCSLGEALSIYTPFYDVEKFSDNTKIDSNIILTSYQKQAFDFIQNHNTSLLFANTGSGKTEIYIKLIEQILNQNKQAVMLLPEISLTPQMEKRLQKVFDDKVAIWHSKITKTKKQSIIQNLLNGKIKLIAGARSALFLPFENLGLIVVDEEHDDSYKSEQKPRINVKDLCIYIAKSHKIKVVLGSATPSLNSFYKIPYFRLNQTFYQTRKEIFFDNSQLGLNDFVINKIASTLKQKKQVIVFLPTRANFKYQICSSCGEFVQCPFCSVSMSLHRNNNALKCHYCNYTQPIATQCPTCKNQTIQNARLGTAEVYEQLASYFPNQTLAKFDKDSMKSQTDLKKTLKDFNDHKIDILIGTQMLSKGHDYHDVTLAVILGIDSVLAMNSYRVREKALSLLLQIAGRSGRKGYGEVIIQTKNEPFFNTYLTQLDYEDFLKNELHTRKELYPPFFKLARVIFSHKNHTIAKNELDQYIQLFVSKNDPDVQLVGFGECAVFKIASKYRYEMLLRSTNISKLLGYLHAIESPYAHIDMDTLL